MKSARIKGVGHFVPPRIVTNDDLSQIMNTNDEWIIERTGIKERRWVEKGDGWTTSTMGAEAAGRAVENSELEMDEVDFIIFATLTPDHYFPGGGVMVQHQLGLGTIGALDVRNQCSGFIYALSIANSFVRSGTYKNILVIGAEVQSPLMDLSDNGRHISVIFGDGAGAVVVGVDENPDVGIRSTYLQSEGLHAPELAVLAPGPQRWVDVILDQDEPFTDDSWRAQMNGNFVFKHAVVRMTEAVNKGLELAELELSDLDLLIPHQANLRISMAVQKRLGLGDDKVFNNIMRYGNTTAASIPIALSEAVAEGKIKRGDVLVLAAFGSGFTWGSAIIRW